MNNTEKLLPCPFCGGEAEKIKNGGLRGVHCSNPRCIAFDIQGFYCKYKKAVKEWNKRFKDSEEPT